MFIFIFIFIFNSLVSLIYKFNKLLFLYEYSKYNEHHIFLSTNDNKQNKYQFQCLLQNLMKITQCTLQKNCIYVHFHFLLSIFTTSMFSVHSSTSGSINFVLHLQFDQYHKIHHIHIHNY